MPSGVKFTRRIHPQKHIEKLRRGYEEAWRDATAFFQRRAAELVAKDTGTLMRGIPLAIRPEDMVKAIRDSFGEEEGAEHLTSILHLRVPYAAWIEYGTAPHSVSKEGVKRLRKWAKRHGFPAKVGDAIAWKIRHHGSDPQPFIRPALRDTIGYLRSRLQQVQPSGGKPTAAPASMLDILARISVFGEKLLGKPVKMIRRILRYAR